MVGCLFYPLTPWYVRKITSPPSGVKREGHGRKMGVGVCSRFRLSAWRPALKDTGKKGTLSKFLKSSTYNVDFKSYLVLRVLA